MKEKIDPVSVVGTSLSIAIGLAAGSLIAFLILSFILSIASPGIKIQ